MLETIDKKPLSSLKYSFNWAKWLRAGPDQAVILTASVWAVEPTGEVTVTGETFDATTTTVRLGGGVEGREYEVFNRVTASNGDTDEESILVRVRR